MRDKAKPVLDKARRYLRAILALAVLSAASLNLYSLVTIAFTATDLMPIYFTPYSMANVRPGSSERAVVEKHMAERGYALAGQEGAQLIFERGGVTVRFDLQSVKALFHRDK